MTRALEYGPAQGDKWLAGVAAPSRVPMPERFEFGIFRRIVTYSRSGELARVNQDETVVKDQGDIG